MPCEFELIKKYFSAPEQACGLSLGNGDDCALFTPPPGFEIAVTTDTLNEGIHFFKGTDPFLLGYKSLLVNISDLAAMGASPWCFTLSLTLPEARDEFLQAFSQGLYSLSRAEGMALIGGNTTKGPLSFTITAFGLVKKGSAMLRSAAVPGEDIYVTGTLGLAALYVECGYGRITAAPRFLKELERACMLIPSRTSFAAKLAQSSLSRCAIDLSDGLKGDLGHILESSHTGAEIWLEALPCAGELADCLPEDEARRIELAACGGGDYELLFTAFPARRYEIARLAEETQVKVTRIGKITSSEYTFLKNDTIYPLTATSFEHF